MSRWLRFGVLALLVVMLAGVATLLSSPPNSPPSPSIGPSGTSSTADSTGAPGSIAPTIAPTPTPIPVLGGAELYGYLPYWQVTEGMAAYLDRVPLSTLAMFSVSARRNGAIDNRDAGYKRITSDLGRRIIADAHRRSARVELVFTSFGEQKNGRFFGRLGRPQAGASLSPSQTPGQTAPTAPPPWQRTVDELASLVRDLDVDGVNVDVEQLDELDREAYGDFLVALRAAVRKVVHRATLTVATEAGLRGTGNAAAAARADVDRVFLMGYDYHWSGSQPGASSPIDRSDGQYTLRWSIEQYVGAGVPRNRILLGLPLYGMSWRTIGPDRSAPVLGKGTSWIPNRHADVLLDPSFVPGRDSLEVAEFFIRPEGDAWRITYYDSPATLRIKLAFARDQGLAGGGLWAIGYERGLPGYLELMRAFRNGKVGRGEAPPAP